MEGNEIPKFDMRTVVGIVMNNWTGLKLAIQHGMGGPPNLLKSKLQLMIDFVMNTIPTLGSSDWQDLGDDLYDMMNDQFSTELEDDSASEVAKEITELFQLWKDMKSNEIAAKIGHLPNQVDIMAEFSPVVSNSYGQSRKSHEITNYDSSPVSMEDEGDAEDSNKWTVVKRK